MKFWKGRKPQEKRKKGEMNMESRSKGVKKEVKEAFVHSSVFVEMGKVLKKGGKEDEKRKKIDSLSFPPPFLNALLISLKIIEGVDESRRGRKPQDRRKKIEMEMERRPKGVGKISFRYSLSHSVHMQVTLKLDFEH